MDNLPKLTEMLTVMTKAYDFGKSVATDPVLAEDTMASLSGFAKPITTAAKALHLQPSKPETVYTLKATKLRSAYLV